MFGLFCVFRIQLRSSTIDKQRFSMSLFSNQVYGDPGLPVSILYYNSDLRKCATKQVLFYVYPLFVRKIVLPNNTSTDGCKHMYLLQKLNSMTWKFVRFVWLCLCGYSQTICAIHSAQNTIALSFLVMRVRFWIKCQWSTETHIETYFKRY